MTHQQIFNKVLFAMRLQGEPSQTPQGWCAYRGPRGLKCAIGHLIPDELYSSSLEGLSIDEAIFDILSKAGLNTESQDTCDLLGAMQSAHDYSARTPSAFQPRFDMLMREVAALRGLRYHSQSCEIKSYKEGSWQVELDGVVAPRLSREDALTLAEQINALIATRDLRQAKIRLTSKAITIGVNE